MGGLFVFPMVERHAVRSVPAAGDEEAATQQVPFQGRGPGQVGWRSKGSWFSLVLKSR